MVGASFLSTRNGSAEKVLRSVASLVYLKFRASRYSLENGFRAHCSRRARHERVWGVGLCNGGRRRYLRVRLVVRRTPPRMRGCERNVAWRIQGRRTRGEYWSKPSLAEMKWTPMRCDMGSQRETSRVPWGQRLIESGTRYDDESSHLTRHDGSVFVIVGRRLVKLF